MRLLPRSFFAREADVVARDLVGRFLVHAPRGGPPRVGRIVETEAYFGPPGRNARIASRADMPARTRAWLARHGDPASHSYRGETARTRVMYGPPGHAYVYLIYGMHECLNVSTGAAGDPQAVLLRAVEPVANVTRSADGPGKLTRALGVTRAQNGVDMTAPPLHVAAGEPAARVVRGPRVNVVGAKHLPLRFMDAASSHVSRPRPSDTLKRRGSSPRA